MNAVVAGWYQVATELEGKPDRGVPVLVTVVSNTGRNPLLIAGAVSSSPSSTPTPVDLAYTHTEGGRVAGSVMTVAPGESRTVSWVLPTSNVWGTDIDSLTLIDVTTGDDLDVLKPAAPAAGAPPGSDGCETRLRAACDHALVQAGAALNPGDRALLREVMCVPQVRTFASLGESHKRYCARWLQESGWAALDTDRAIAGYLPRD